MPFGEHEESERGSMDSAVYTRISAVFGEYWVWKVATPRGRYTLTGQRREVGFDRVLYPEITLLPAR